MNEIVLDATIVAPPLGLSPQRFMALWRRGIIRSSFERGIDEDSGRCRITLRYLAAKAEFVLSDDGTMLSVRKVAAGNNEEFAPAQRPQRPTET